MNQINKDLDHLRWLSVFHYISAAISFLFIGLTLLQFYGEFGEVKELLQDKNNHNG